MKPPMFHVGQAVVLVEPILFAHPDATGPDPKVGPIYTIHELEWEQEEQEWYLGLAGFDESNFIETSFRAVELLPDEALAQLLEETLAPPVTA